MSSCLANESDGAANVLWGFQRTRNKRIGLDQTGDI